MKKYTLLPVLGLTTWLTACGDQNAGDLSEAKIIIGENDLQYYVKDDDITNSIGRIALGCTATHIGNGYVLTAGHCVSSNTCNSSSYNITWGYTVDNRSGRLVSKCQEVVARENNSQRDYAVLRYSPAPKASLSVNTSRRPKAGDRITIFSHPNGVPLSWSGYCYHEGHFSGQKFSYKCDTMGGSSGAAILNDKFEIVGVHNLGSSYYQVNAGTYLADIPLFQ